MEEGRVGEATGAPAEAAEAGAPARRRYERPELVAFGSVHELTRGGTRTSGDGGTRRK